MIIHCKIYFMFFYFHGLRKPQKYFYSENFQIYGNTLDHNNEPCENKQLYLIDIILD